MKTEFSDAPDETVGQRIGRYKILECVGEGGCGVVYVAEQAEPVRRVWRSRSLSWARAPSRLPRHAPSPAPNSRLIPSTSAVISGASTQPVFTGTFGLDLSEVTAL